MHLSIAIIMGIILSALVRFSDGVPIASRELTFNRTIGGHYIEVTGSIQDILTDVERQYPGFHRETLGDSFSDLAEMARSGDPVEERDVKVSHFLYIILMVSKICLIFFPMLQDLCWPVAGQPWEEAMGFHVQEGIHYLGGFKGTCEIPRGWGGVCESVL